MTKPSVAAKILKSAKFRSRFKEDMEKIEIRKATMNDLEPITVLILLCSEKFILPEMSAQGQRAYLESHDVDMMAERIKNYDYHVAVLPDDEIVGVVGVKDRKHIFHLHVHPSFQEQGLGRKLWKHAKAMAEELGNVKEFTVNSSKYAIEFYRKLGFTGSEEKITNGVPYYPMRFKN